MGVHTGEAVERDGDYFGTAVNRAARLMAAGGGGQVLVSQATAALLDGESDLVDLGEFRLRDLSAAQRIHQLGPGTFPRLRTMDSYPGNLPVDLTSFVGRRAEIAQVADLVAGHRLVTLVGVGGVGKSRLATQVASALLPRFEHGAWLVELAPLGDPSSVTAAIAAVLGVQAQPGLSVAATLAEYFSARDLLLVLDNCEHLLDGVAEFVEPLLARSRGLRVLATSREALDLPGEQVLPVGSLECPRPGSVVDDLEHVDAVTLFVDRVRLARPDFAVDDPDAVAELCTRLDGIPLALELAAAQVAVLSPRQIADRLDARFRLLSGGRRSRVERHRTLTAAVDWSYHLLEPDEQRCFDELSVFAGSFSLGAAAAVCAVSEDDALRLVSGLVRQSMVVVVPGQGESRYRLLETLRQYGQAKLAERPDAADVGRRHAGHYADVAAAGAQGLKGPDGLAWRDELRADLDNLRAAFERAIADADADLALRIVSDLGWLGLLHTSLGLEQWMLTAIDLPGARDHPLFAEVAGWAVHIMGNLLTDPAHGERLLAEAMTAVAAGRSNPTARPARARGVLGFFASDPDAVVGPWREAVDQLETTDDVAELAVAVADLAAGCALSGRHAEASLQAERARQLAERLDAPLVRAWVDVMTAICAAWAHPETALPAARRAQEVADRTGAEFLQMTPRHAVVVALLANSRRHEARAAVLDIAELASRCRNAMSLHGAIRHALDAGLFDEEPHVAATLANAFTLPDPHHPGAERYDLTTWAAAISLDEIVKLLRHGEPPPDG